MDKIQAKKRFGQNFLINTGVQEQFAKEAEKLLKSHGLHKILEIGPGMGAVTQDVSKLAAELSAIEMDPEAIEYLKTQHFAQNIELQQGDALELLSKPYDLTDLVVVSNLPFNVGSRILVELSLQDVAPPWVCVLQKEVMSKLLKQDVFSVFGAWMQLFWEFKRVLDISPGSFQPAPKVVSTLVVATPKPAPDFLQTRTAKRLALDWLKTLVRYPSKRLTNNLKDKLSTEELKKLYRTLGFNDNTRLDNSNYLGVLEFLVKNDLNPNK